MCPLLRGCPFFRGSFIGGSTVLTVYIVSLSDITLIFRKCQLSDLEAIDIGFYNSLKYVQDNDPEPLDLNFAVLEETFGEVGGAY